MTTPVCVWGGGGGGEERGGDGEEGVGERRQRGERDKRGGEMEGRAKEGIKVVSLTGRSHTSEQALL